MPKKYISAQLSSITAESHKQKPSKQQKAKPLASSAKAGGQDGQPRAIAFASRGLSKSERKYPAHKLEFLALKWAVTEKFSDYLYGTDGLVCLVGYCL